MAPHPPPSCTTTTRAARPLGSYPCCESWRLSSVPFCFIWGFRFKDTFLWRRKSISAATGECSGGLKPPRARSSSAPPLVVLQVAEKSCVFVKPDAASFRRNCAYVAGAPSPLSIFAPQIYSIFLFFFFFQSPRPTLFSFHHCPPLPNDTLQHRRCHFLHS